MSSQKPFNASSDAPIGISGEWLFQRSGQVFGPVPAHVLVQMLYRGEITAETPVAGDDGVFIPLIQLPPFLVHVKKAEAQQRVEAEVTGARILKRRKRIKRGVVVGVLALGLLGMGGYGAYWLATVKPWQKRSALLEDFGDGIQLAMPAKVGGRHTAAEQEVEVPLQVASTTGTAPRRSTPSATGTHPSRPSSGGGGSGSGNDLVASYYDTGHIQSVVAHEQRMLASCLRAEAARSPDFRGDIPIEFAIGNDGRVARLWIDEPRFKRGELYDCLFRTLKTWTFRSFPGERPTVSLSFRIGAR